MFLWLWLNIVVFVAQSSQDEFHCTKLILPPSCNLEPFITIPKAFIVQFQEPPLNTSPIVIEKTAQEFLVEVQKLNIHPQLKFVLPLFQGVAITLDNMEDFQKLCTMSVVKSIWPEVSFQLEPFHHQSSGGCFSSRHHHRSHLHAADSNHKFSGKNIRVGIIDSGVFPEHEAFGHSGFGPGEKFVCGTNYLRNGSLPLDFSGHGTSVTGIIGGKCKEFSGLAPDAELGIYQVFRDEGGKADLIHIMRALEKAVQDKMDIINLSLGIPGWPNSPHSIQASLATRAGIIVTSAVGNSGENGIFGCGAPAVGEGVLAVGSCGHSSGLVEKFFKGISHKNPPLCTRISEFSSCGPSPDLNLSPLIMAPGEDILSTSIKGEYSKFTGTSMASPFIAGIAANYLEKHGRKASLHFTKALLNTATPLPDKTIPGRPASVIYQGAGVINPGKLLNATNYVSPCKLALGWLNSKNNSIRKERLSLYNHGEETKYYEVSHNPAVTVEVDSLKQTTVNTYSIQLKIEPFILKVDPKSSADVVLSFFMDSIEQEQRCFVSGFVEFKECDDNEDDDNSEINIRVPYLAQMGRGKGLHAFDHKNPPNLVHKRKDIQDVTVRGANISTPLTASDHLQVQLNLLFPVSSLAVSVVSVQPPYQEVEIGTFSHVGSSQATEDDRLGYKIQILAKKGMEQGKQYKVKIMAYNPMLSKYQTDFEWLSLPFTFSSK